MRYVYPAIRPAPAQLTTLGIRALADMILLAPIVELVAFWKIDGKIKHWAHGD